MSVEERKTDELLRRERRREREETDRGERESDLTDAHTHARRAEKASYLREKLEERARSERDVEGR